MSSYAGQIDEGNNKGGGLKFFLIVAFIITVIVAGGIAISYLFPLLPNIHPYKHGAASLTIDECLNSLGSLETWQRKSDNRIAKICEVNTDLFGVKIEESWGAKVTGFIKEKLNALWKVERYLINSGYECISGCEGITPGVFR